MQLQDPTLALDDVLLLLPGELLIQLHPHLEGEEDHLLHGLFWEEERGKDVKIRNDVFEALRGFEVK